MPRIVFIIIELALIGGILFQGVAVIRKQTALNDPSSAPPMVATLPGTAAVSNEQLKPFTAYQAIAQRDLFKTPKDDSAAEKAFDVANLKPTELKLKLWGTITGEDGLTRAVIEDQTRKEQAFFRAGDDIASAKIKMILREKVVLSVDGENQVLEIEQATGTGGPTMMTRLPHSPSPPAAPSPARPEAAVSRSIRMKLDRIGPISDNPEDWGNDVAVTPFEGNGGQNGLMINRITPSSPLRRLGIRNGDVVISINDQSVGAIGDLFEPLLEMTEGEALKLKFNRRGKERQIDFQFE